MKKIKTFVSPFANMVPTTNVKDDLVSIRRLAKVLNMIADKADNKMPKRDDDVLVASMYPQVPHITYGMVRAAIEEVDLIEDSHKNADMVMPTGTRGKTIGKDFTLPKESKHRAPRIPKFTTRRISFPNFEAAKREISRTDE